MISFKRRDIGWAEINETFTRWEFRTSWFGIMLHRMHAPIKHEHYHDHPWNFLAIVLKGGYWETIADGTDHWRGPGSVMWRTAETKHKTTTELVSWSICFTGPRIRAWRGDLQ